MRAFLPLALAALLALPLAGASHALPLANATYVDATGAWEAQVRIRGSCNGPVVLEVFVVRGFFGDYYEVPGHSTMVPDVCAIECLDCPVPFVWTIATDGYLAGGGLAGFTPAWSLQGTFLDGALELRGTPFL